MLALAGVPLGLSFRFLDPSPDACAAEVGELVVAPYDDPDGLGRLADGAAAGTYATPSGQLFGVEATPVAVLNSHRARPTGSAAAA